MNPASAAVLKVAPGDGTPLVWASRWLGNPLPERVAGSDPAPALLQSAAEKGYRVFLLGAADGVAAAATERLQQQYPLLQVVGHYAPPFPALLEMNHDEILRRVQAAKPDILLVSFGCPKQEKWIAMPHRTLGVPVTIGVGATLDFLAGRKKRAPSWMRRTGTEWLYRLAQEPRRLYKRYACDVVYFVPLLTQQWWRLRTRPHASSRAQEFPLKKPGWRAVGAGTHRPCPTSVHRQFRRCPDATIETMDAVPARGGSVLKSTGECSECPPAYRPRSSAPRRRAMKCVAENRIPWR